MTTFVSMLTWHGDRQPRPEDVRAALERRSPELRAAGLHSLVFLPDEGDCAAVMIASCTSTHDVRRIAASICPGAAVRVESMPFDEGTAPGAGREALPLLPGEYLATVLDAVVSG